MTIQSPQDLFFYDLCAMYDVEQKLVQVLPTLAQESQYSQIREVFAQHEQETRQHVSNLEQCFQILGRPPVQLESHSVVGLKEDHDAFLQQQPSPDALTMFDLHAGSQTEYMEMAAYNALIDAANSLGLQQCIPLFQQNLQQEEAAARKLAVLTHQLGQQQAQHA
jgi:ferritin-like metal-binding protein YciE